MSAFAQNSRVDVPARCEGDNDALAESIALNLPGARLRKSLVACMFSLWTESREGIPSRLGSVGVLLPSSRPTGDGSRNLVGSGPARLLRLRVVVLEGCGVKGEHFNGASANPDAVLHQEID